MSKSVIIPFFSLQYLIKSTEWIFLSPWKNIPIHCFFITPYFVWFVVHYCLHNCLSSSLIWGTLLVCRLICFSFKISNYFIFNVLMSFIFRFIVSIKHIWNDISTNCKTETTKFFLKIGSMLASYYNDVSNKPH